MIVWYAFPLKTNISPQKIDGLEDEIFSFKMVRFLGGYFFVGYYIPIEVGGCPPFLDKRPCPIQWAFHLLDPPLKVSRGLVGMFVMCIFCIDIYVYMYIYIYIS